MTITAATPMMMPSMVRVARILFLRMACNASFTRVMIFMRHSCGRGPRRRLPQGAATVFSSCHQLLGCQIRSGVASIVRGVGCQRLLCHFVIWQQLCRRQILGSVSAVLDRLVAPDAAVAHVHDPFGIDRDIRLVRD